MAIMVLGASLLANKDFIATQWLQSLLEGLGNSMNHKQTLQNSQTPTMRRCQSKNTAGAVVDQVIMEQTLYIQIRENKETEKKS